MSMRNRTFGGVRKRRSIKHLVVLEKGFVVGDKRERRLNSLHLSKGKSQLAGTYSPEIPHVVTRRRSSARVVIHLTQVVPSGVHNLSIPSVV